MAQAYEGDPLEQEIAIDVQEDIQFDDEHPLVDESTVAANEADEEDDKESYSKRVQKRIDKLAYERNIERDKTARMEAEMADMREKLEALSNARQQEEATRTLSTLEEQRQELIQRKKDALYISDFDSVADIDEQLLELKLKTAPAAQPPKPEQTQEPQPQARMPDALVQWEAKNQWLYDARQTARKEKANQVFMKMINEEGFDHEDPETYDVLDRRLKRVAPPPVGAPDRGQVMNSASDYVFTPEIKEQMRGFGLDPNNAAQRVEWALNHKS